MNQLDKKINEIFYYESVFKTPKKYSLFSGKILPSFIKDWLIKKFTDEQGNIDEDMLLKFMNEKIPDKNSKIKGRLIEKNEDIEILARLTIEPDIKNGIFRFSIPDLGIKLNEGRIPNSIVKNNKELHGGEVWGIIKLMYQPPTKKEKGYILLISYKPFKPYKNIDLDYFKEKRKQFTTEEWIDFLIRSMEYNPDGFNGITQKILFLTRLLPFVESNLNLIELAPKGTGKSYVYTNLSKYGWIVSGGTVTRAKLLYDISKQVPGIIRYYDFIALDEIETIKFSDEEEILGALKNYLENGTYTVANYKGMSEAGFVFLGNISLNSYKKPISKRYFSHLSDFFNNSALLDRFHGFIEGWQLPRMREDLKVNGFALNVEYFTEILHILRKDIGFSYLAEELLNIPKSSDVRDKKAIIKMISGYLKLFFPHINDPSKIDKKEFENYCFIPAFYKRAIIKKQRSYIDSEVIDKMPEITVK